MDPLVTPENGIGGKTIGDISASDRNTQDGAFRIRFDLDDGSSRADVSSPAFSGTEGGRDIVGISVERD